jgi:hypothetical protein
MLQVDKVHTHGQEINYVTQQVILQVDKAQTLGQEIKSCNTAGHTSGG